MSPPSITDLPPEIIEKILSFVSYNQISKLREVCTLFNEIGSSLLNSCFQRLQNVMHQKFQQIKSQMPRRESARRSHPLARECDIFETVHMRLTLLQMSFGKHIERKHCCFFAGEILDEVYHILKYIKTMTPNLQRAYKVTDELFDLTTMAMEYFKDNIESGLPEITYFTTDFLDCSPTGHRVNSCTLHSLNPAKTTAGSNDPVPVEDLPEVTSSMNVFLKKRLKHLKQGMKRNNCRLTFLKREVKAFANQMAEQQKQLIEYGSRMEEYDKKLEENNRKLRAILQDLNKCKTELQYWRSKSPANQLCGSCGSSQLSAAESPEAISGAGNVESGSDVTLDVEPGKRPRSTSISLLEPVPKRGRELALQSLSF